MMYVNQLSISSTYTLSLIVCISAARQCTTDFTRRYHRLHACTASTYVSGSRAAARFSNFERSLGLKFDYQTCEKLQSSCCLEWSQALTLQGMDRPPSPSSKPYVPVRFIHYGPFMYYYPYGNMPAEDLLEHVHFEDEREPAVLILGCGDINSCFFTLWKHFDPAVSGRHFFGVRFVLNDLCGAMLARNVLFLYLTMKIPPWTQSEAAKQWLSNMWAIWYCHELLPIHEETLKNALDNLMSFSESMESWSSTATNPLRKIVRVTDEGTLSKMRDAWKLWRTFQFGSVESVQKDRYGKVPHIGEDNMSPCVMRITPWLQATHGPVVTASMYDEMNKEYSQYIDTGNVFAEPCLDLPYSTHSSIVNPTIFEREDKMYTLDYTCLPFENFHHGFVVSKAMLQKAGLDYDVAGQPLVVEDESFEKYPMLSNCLQQFSIWVSSTAAILNDASSKANTSIFFMLNCSECIHFCEKVQMNPKLFYSQTDIQPVFDAIYTSNLIDRLTPPVLVSVAKPFLKKSGCLVTTPYLYRCAANSAEQYLEDTFGFSPELFPIMMGMRCIGHDGNYFSGTSILPLPVSGLEALLADFECSRYEKPLIWHKVDAWPINIPCFSPQMATCKALYGSLRTVVKSFFETYATVQGFHTRSAMCIETAFKAILLFASQLDAEVDLDNYLFWECLCMLVKKDSMLTPFFHHIQTQALLHGLHFHLIYDPKNCPICLKQPVKKIISHFTMEFNQFKMNVVPNYFVAVNDTPSFLVIIHKAPISHRIHSVDSLFATDHVIDSIQGESTALGKVSVNFYFLNSFISDDYFASVIRYVSWSDDPSDRKSISKCVPSAVQTWKLGQLTVLPFTDYSFAQGGVGRVKGAYSGLGTVLSHFGEADHMETNLQLSPKALTAANAKNVCIKYLSHYSVDVYCGKQHLAVRYPYPVEHARSKYHVYEGKKTMGFIIPRAKYKFYNEKPVFFVNPNNRMALPSLGVNADNLRSLCSMQFSVADRKLLDSTRNHPIGVNPTLNIKEALALVFQHTQVSVFEFCQPTDMTKLLGTVVVNRRAIDAIRRTAVVDVSFMIVDPHVFRGIVRHWEAMMEEVQMFHGDMQIPLLDNEWIILKQILLYYASRTLPGTKFRSHILKKHSLEKHHTRAVLYPLYCDQDGISGMFQEMKNDIYPKLLKAYQQGVTANATTISSPYWDRASASAFLSPSSSPAPPLAVPSNFMYVANAKDIFPTTAEESSLSHKPTKDVSSKSVTKVLSSGPVVSRESRSRCTYCGETATKLKKCTGCGKTWYCGKDCQTKHWKDHKKVCKPPVAELPTNCSNCGKETAFLKRCGACQNAAYCTKECQRNDWTRHKLSCTKK